MMQRGSKLIATSLAISVITKAVGFAMLWWFLS
jgi:hypothetical protein